MVKTRKWIGVGTISYNYYTNILTLQAYAISNIITKKNQLSALTKKYTQMSIYIVHSVNSYI